MTDYMTANTINDLFRSLFALLDKAAYTLLGWMYEILFNVASADIFANDTVQKFYGRMQMIIGVFMLFKLAVSIIQGIINPDTFTDKKAGFSTIIGRVVFALILLTALTPINIPGARSSYEINLNNNGLLFGTLYELQDRILENNTLGRLILGTGDGGTFSNNAQTQAERLKKSANMFTSTILKGFVRINLKESGSDETKPEDRVCSYIEQDVLDAYADLEASPNEILSLVNASCEYQNATGFFATMGKFFTRLFTGDRYIFAYLPIISTIAAAIFIYILVGEIITIAIRSVKLAVLRLLAPIPIISYIDPKSEKDGAFGAWVKTLTSTYLELFIHLAVIYFVIFLIQDMIVNGLVINSGTGVIGVVSCIFIWIGLFFFVRQAPKFIQNILGVKGNAGNFGIGAMLAATGALRQGGTWREAGEAFMDSTRDYTNAYNAGKAPPALGMSYEAGRDHVAKILTGDNNMTGRKMSRGQRHLDAMGISTPYANDLKEKMYAAQTEAAIAESLKERANSDGWSSLTNDEQSKIEAAYRRYLDNYNAGRPVSQQKSFSQTELERDGATIYADEVSSAAGKAKSKYDKVSGMQKVYGQARSYEAEYEENPDNRAAGAFGRTSGYSAVQRWRTQKYDSQGASASTTPSNSSPGGPDMTPTGSTGGGVGGHGGGPGGGRGPGGGPPARP